MSIFPNPSPQGPIPPAPPQGAPPPYNPPPQYAAPPQYVVTQPPSEGGWKFVVLLVAVLALIGGGVYLYMQLDKAKQDLVKTNDALQARIDKLEEATSVTTRSNRKTTEELREQLEPGATHTHALDLFNAKKAVTNNNS